MNRNLKKTLSSYNEFMRVELSKMKSERPDLTYKECFKIVCEMWKTSPNNPRKA
jgi:hypothetical protein